MVTTTIENEIEARPQMQTVTIEEAKELSDAGACILWHPDGKNHAIVITIDDAEALIPHLKTSAKRLFKDTLQGKRQLRFPSLEAGWYDSLDLKRWGNFRDEVTRIVEWGTTFSDYHVPSGAPLLVCPFTPVRILTAEQWQQRKVLNEKYSHVKEQRREDQILTECERVKKELFPKVSWYRKNLHFDQQVQALGILQGSMVDIIKTVVKGRIRVNQGDIWNEVLEIVNKRILTLLNKDGRSYQPGTKKRLKTVECGPNFEGFRDFVKKYTAKIAMEAWTEGITVGTDEHIWREDLRKEMERIAFAEISPMVEKGSLAEELLKNEIAENVKKTVAGMSRSELLLTMIKRAGTLAESGDKRPTPVKTNLGPKNCAIRHYAAIFQQWSDWNNVTLECRNYSKDRKWQEERVKQDEGVADNVWWYNQYEKLLRPEKKPVHSLGTEQGTQTKIKPLTA